MKTFTIIYLIGLILSACWIDGMETNYRPVNDRDSFFKCVIINTIWPITIPISMIVLASGENRWSTKLKGETK